MEYQISNSIATGILTSARFGTNCSISDNPTLNSILNDVSFVIAILQTVSDPCRGSGQANLDGS